MTWYFDVRVYPEYLQFLVRRMKYRLLPSISTFNVQHLDISTPTSTVPTPLDRLESQQRIQKEDGTTP